MALTYSGSQIITGPFTNATRSPLDQKTVVSSHTDLQTVPNSYNGLIVYVETGTYTGAYLLKDSENIDPGSITDYPAYLSSTWESLASGSGSGVINSATSAGSIYGITDSQGGPQNGPFSKTIGYYASAGNTISELSASVMSIEPDDEFLILKRSWGDKALHVNGWIEAYADAGDSVWKNYVNTGTDQGGDYTWDEAIEIVDNEIYLNATNQNGDGSIRYERIESGSGRRLSIKQGLNQQAGSLTFRFPPDSGASGQILSTDGSGNTSWINDTSGGGGAGSGTVSNSNEAGVLAWYQASGTTIHPTTSTRVKLENGEVLALGGAGAALKFTDGTDFSATFKGGPANGSAGELLTLTFDTSSGSTPQTYFDIVSNTQDPCIRIEPTQTAVGSSTKPAIKIGSGGLGFYTTVKDSYIQADNPLGAMVFRAGDSSQTVLETHIALDSGKIYLENPVYSTGDFVVFETAIEAQDGIEITGSDIEITGGGNLWAPEIITTNINGIGNNIYFRDDVVATKDLIVGQIFGVTQAAVFGYIPDGTLTEGLPCDVNIHGGPLTEPANRIYGPTITGANYSRLTIECNSPLGLKTTSQNNPHHDGPSNESWGSGETSPPSGPVLAFDSYRFGPNGAAFDFSASRYCLTDTAANYPTLTFHQGHSTQYVTAAEYCLQWVSTSQGQAHLGNSAWATYQVNNDYHSFPTWLEIGDVVVAPTNMFADGSNTASVTDVDHAAKYVEMDKEVVTYVGIELIEFWGKKKDIYSWEVFKQSRDEDYDPIHPHSHGMSMTHESLNFKPLGKIYTQTSGSSFNTTQMDFEVSMRIQPNGTVECGQTFVNGSSREIKQNIEELSEEKANLIIDELQPVSFEYRATPNHSRLGFIAEDVPEYIAEKNRKGLSSMGIVAALTGAVKSQKTEIDGLKEEMEELKNLILNLGVN